MSSKQCHNKKKNGTYHYLHRSRPPADSSIPLNEEVRFSFIDDFSDSVLATSRAGRAADIGQLEDDLDNLGDRRVRKRSSNAVVEPGAVKVVRIQWPAGVDSGRIREVGRLYRHIHTK